MQQMLLLPYNASTIESLTIIISHVPTDQPPNKYANHTYMDVCI